MQGKSKYYFPNNLLFAALANILGRANPHTIFPPILYVSGVFGFCGNIRCGINCFMPQGFEARSVV